MSEVTLRLGELDLTRGSYSTHVGSSFGGWQSLTSETSSLFLDGSRVLGEASGNRQIVLRVRVEEPSRYGLIEACEALLVEANKQANTLTFSPSGGPDVVYEVFRVQSPERVDDESEAWDYREYELTFPALPFARSSVRESTGALAPAVTLTEFEAAFTGSRMDRMWDSNYYSENGYYYPDNSYPGGGGSYYIAPINDPTVSALSPASTVGWLAVLNWRVSYAEEYLTRDDNAGSTRTVPHITGTAPGDAEIRSDTTWASSNEFVTAAVNLSAGTDWTSGVTMATVGIEWLDAASVTVRTDWGAPMNLNSFATGWAVAPRPSTATAFRIRVRLHALNAGVTKLLTNYVAVGSVSETITPSTAAGSYRQGNSGVDLGAQESPFGSNSTEGDMPSYLYGTLPSAVDISGKRRLTLWVKPARAYTDLSPSSTRHTLSLRLWDSMGNWSRWSFYPGALDANVYVNLAVDLASPISQSDGGGVDFGDVVAFDIDARTYASGATTPAIGLQAWFFDSLIASDQPTGANSTRGTVYDLEPIVGSARTTAQVELSSSLNLTDWLVAAVPGDSGLPMLSIINGKATAPSPAVHEGVFSVIGGQAPGGTALGTSCTITQKINGTTVATKTLTGLARTGGHYIDYGAVALPLVPTPADNRGVSIEFTFAAGSTGEVLIIDVDASLAWVDNLATAMPHAWVDEPEATASLGKVWVGTQPDRSDARGLTNPPTLSRPLQVKAPSTRLLVYSTTTAPDVELSYYPRWLIEPTA